MIYQLPIEIVGIVCLNLVSLVIQWRYILSWKASTRFGCAANVRLCRIIKWQYSFMEYSRVNTVLIDLRKPHHSTRNFVHWE